MSAVNLGTKREASMRRKPIPSLFQVNLQSHGMNFLRIIFNNIRQIHLYEHISMDLKLVPDYKNAYYFMFSKK